MELRHRKKPDVQCTPNPVLLHIISFLGSSQKVDSGVYIWSTKLRRFKLFQNIMTTGAYDWTYFRVNGYHFLAVAQAFDGFSTLTDSRIYVLQDKKFVLFQTMEVHP